MSNTNTWSTTAANNNGTPPDGFPEGMQYSDVNNAARELMAAVARDRENLSYPLATNWPFRGQQVYSTAGVYTWTKPAGVTKAWVRVVGAGGGGGQQASAGGGGGGGGWAESLVDLTSISSVTVTVGAAGAGATGAPGGNYQGGTGGTSSFGALLSATGGAGGQNRGGNGGVGTGGDVNGSYGPGGCRSNLATSVDTFAWCAGNGGGPGGLGNFTVALQNGANGLAAGGGGAGGNLDGQGGSGIAGQVIIRY